MDSLTQSRDAASAIAVPSNFFFRLPDDILKKIWTNWLPQTFDQISRLDTAFLNHDIRDNFLISIKGLCLSGICKLITKRLLVEYDFDGNDREIAIANETFNIGDVEIAKWRHISNWVKSRDLLVHLAVGNICLPFFVSLFRTCPDLQSFIKERVTSLSIAGVYNERSVLHQPTIFPAVTCLAIEASSLAMSQLIPVFQAWPSIASLSLHLEDGSISCTLDELNIVRTVLLQELQKLKLHFCCCFAYEDEVVWALTSKKPKLRSLTIYSAKGCSVDVLRDVVPTLRYFAVASTNNPIFSISFASWSGGNDPDKDSLKPVFLSEPQQLSILSEPQKLGNDNSTTINEAKLPYPTFEGFCERLQKLRMERNHNRFDDMMSRIIRHDNAYHIELRLSFQFTSSTGYNDLFHQYWEGVSSHLVSLEFEEVSFDIDPMLWTVILGNPKLTVLKFFSCGYLETSLVTGLRTCQAFSLKSRLTTLHIFRPCLSVRRNESYIRRRVDYKEMPPLIPVVFPFLQDLRYVVNGACGMDYITFQSLLPNLVELHIGWPDDEPTEDEESHHQLFSLDSIPRQVWEAFLSTAEKHRHRVKIYFHFLFHHSWVRVQELATMSPIDIACICIHLRFPFQNASVAALSAYRGWEAINRTSESKLFAESLLDLKGLLLSIQLIF